MKPPRFIGTLEWMQRKVRIKGKAFSIEDYHWLIEPAEIADRCPGVMILCLFPPQVFKTLFLQGKSLRDVAVAPRRALWYSPTGKDAKDLASEKLIPLRNSIPDVMAKLPDDSDQRGTKVMHLYVDAPFSMYSADVDTHRNSKSGETGYLDEPWLWAPGHLKEIISRFDDAKWLKSIIAASTGSQVDDEVDVFRKSSSQHEWHVVCLHCGSLVLLEFGDKDSAGGIKWDSDQHTREPDGRWKVEIAKRTARWICPECKAATKFSEAAQKQLSDRRRGARYVQMNPAPDPAKFTFRAEAVVFRDWEELVGEWLEAVNAKRLGDPVLVEEFVRKKRVKAWDPSMMISTDKSYPYGNYNMLDDWPDEGVDLQGRPLRIMWVDVQSTEYWATARRWSNRPKAWAHSRLMAFRNLKVDGQIEDLRKELGVIPERVVLDCAWDPETVRRICTRYGYRSANADKAKDYLHEDGLRRIFSPIRYIDAFLGTDRQGLSACVDFLYSSTSAKYRLNELRKSKTPEGEYLWTIARDTPPEYLRQAWAEYLSRRRGPRGGWIYEFKELHADNHAYDDEVGIVAYASMMDLLGHTSNVPPEVIFPE